jgi:hypothetical protein
MTGLAKKVRKKMKSTLFFKTAGIAALGFFSAIAAWAEHGSTHNGCMDFFSVGSFAGINSSSNSIRSLVGSTSDELDFFFSPDGILLKDEPEVHFNMLVDLDLQSLEEETLVLVTCRVGSGSTNASFQAHGQNSRFIYGETIDNILTTVQIPICISRVSDPRLATHWKCKLDTTKYQVLQDGGHRSTDFITMNTVGSGFPDLEPAAGTTSVKEIGGALLFAADAPIVFEAGQ